MYRGAIIGGTGFESLGEKEGKKEVVTTPFGEAEVFLGGNDLVFVSRHHKDHSIAPHLINYRANIWALKMLGVSSVISLYAVGSISEILSPGTVGIVQDFVDFSTGRINTFYDGTVNKLRHSDLSLVVNSELALKFEKEAKEVELPLQTRRGVYISTSGPRLETCAEIRAFRKMGCDFVGMTMGTEAPLCIEAEMKYLPVAFSVNWAAGVNPTSINFLSDEKIAILSDKITQAAINTLL